MKLVERELGPHHVSCDIGCHLFSILPPFNIGATTMGYGLGWAGAAAFNTTAKPASARISVMGDGGFWHNGLTSGVGNAVFNQSDSVLVVVDNSYTAATGGQDILSSQPANPIRTTKLSIADAVRGVGVKWVRTVTRTYDVARMRDVLKRGADHQGEGPQGDRRAERVHVEQAAPREAATGASWPGQAKRVVRERFGVDADTCTGDHSCIRLSGCPSLTIGTNPDPLRKDPVATVIDSCVGCGLCGEVAHAAVLCPSFYRADVISNPSGWERIKARARQAVIRLAQRRIDRRLAGYLADGAAVDGTDSTLAVRRVPDARQSRRPRATTVAILAMGGEGGGVLADWIVDLAEHAGYYAQTTSVPGVAQRTGATIYYLEIFPEASAKASAQEPVLALMPVPGEVDVVIASELMEAGRAVQRGLVTPDRTTLIASTHRVYSMTERTAIGDGRVDANALVDAGAAAAKTFVRGDFARMAEETRQRDQRVALRRARCHRALPFSRDQFEDAIRRGGVGVESSLAAFAAGHAAAERPASTSAAPSPAAAAAPGSARGAHVGPRIAGLVARLERSFPATSHDILLAGVTRCADYQDERYAALYLDRLDVIRDVDASHGRDTYALLRETGRYLALWMTYEDAIRVADLKIRRTRFERVHQEVRARDKQVLQINEFLHPRVEELTDIMPRALGRWLLGTRWARSAVERVTRHGRIVTTTSLSGFFQLYAIASLRRWRRRSLRFQSEQRSINDWLAQVLVLAPEDYELALSVAECPRLLKGYGDTHHRGVKNFDIVMAAIPALRRHPDPAASIRGLRDAALADDTGERLAAAMREMG